MVGVLSKLKVGSVPSSRESDSGTFLLSLEVPPKENPEGAAENCRDVGSRVVPRGGCSSIEGIGMLKEVAGVCSTVFRTLFNSAFKAFTS